MRRLGISVSSDAVRAVVVRSGRVVWHARSAIGKAERAGASLDRLLSDVPPARFGRTRVRVAFGFVHSHVKRVEGLPPARHPKLLNRVVKENADAFFLRLGTRTLVTDVERRSDGSTWAAALDGPLVDEVLGTLRKRGLATTGVLPFAAAASLVLPAGAWCMSDGGREAELTTIEGGVIQSWRRTITSVRAAGLPPVVDALIGLGPDAAQFIAAYGAAVAPARAAFTWRPAPDPGRVRALDVARVVAASILLVASTGAALFARGAHAQRVAAVAAKEVASFRDSQIDAARVDAELRRTTADLDRIRQFGALRGRMTMLVGALSEALPDSTALVSLRVDSLEGTLVALAPHAANVLPQLFDVPGVVAPRIVGSVTREAQGAARVERASIRFRCRALR